MLALIVAYARGRVIGNKGCIPWRIKGEQKRFKELTTGNVVIMGRRTYEEIGRPLPNRTTIVVSSTMKEADLFKSSKAPEQLTSMEQPADGGAAGNEGEIYLACSLEEAIELAGDKGGNIYISGGAGLYAEVIDMVDKMYITQIEADIEGDTFFPEFDEELFDKVTGEHFDGEIPYTYMEYTRKKIL